MSELVSEEVVVLNASQAVSSGELVGGCIPALGDTTDDDVAWHRPRVLVVEDNKEARETVAEFLRSGGFDVVEAPSAELGLEQLKCHRFEAVVTDYSLPSQTGVWMIATARAAGLLRNDNVLLLTGFNKLEGIDGLRVLRKPFDLVSLRLEVEGACMPPVVKS